MRSRKQLFVLGGGELARDLWEELHRLLGTKGYSEGTHWGSGAP